MDIAFKSAKSNGGGLELSELKDFKKFLIEYKKLFKMKKEIIGNFGTNGTALRRPSRRFVTDKTFQKNPPVTWKEGPECRRHGSRLHFEGFGFPVSACLDGISKVSDFRFPYIWMEFRRFRISGFRMSGWNFEGFGFPVSVCLDGILKIFGFLGGILKGREAERQISPKVHGFLGGISKVFGSLVSVYLDGILKVTLQKSMVSASWAAFRRSRTPKCGALIWPNLQEIGSDLANPIGKLAPICHPTGKSSPICRNEWELRNLTYIGFPD
ncbi:unnamed protein product [Rhizophagus irregularis]|nr:unnamed protein product [Rhizophagus irregularis]